MQQHKIKVLDQADEKSADEIQRIFNIKSKDQVEAILKSTERVSGVIRSSNKDKHSEFLASFH